MRKFLKVVLNRHDITNDFYSARIIWRLNGTFGSKYVFYGGPLSENSSMMTVGRCRDKAKGSLLFCSAK